jgi:hypothetical protein
MSDFRFNPFDEDWRRMSEDLGVRYPPMLLFALAFATMFWWTRRAVVSTLATIGGARTKTSKT